MNKQVLIISTSPRQGGNSETLADEFAKGAQEAGHHVEKVVLYDKTIGFCKGCLSCQKNHACIIKDDVSAILEKLLVADVVVFSTPIYFYEMSGQMKTLLDRTNPIFPASYKFRNIYLLATAADLDENAMDGAIHGLQGWINCFGKTNLTGVVRSLGAYNANSSAALQSAYNMGKSIAK